MTDSMTNAHFLAPTQPLEVQLQERRVERGGMLEESFILLNHKNEKFCRKYASNNAVPFHVFIGIYSARDSAIRHPL